MTQNWEFLLGYTNIVVNGVIIFIIILNIVVHKFRRAELTEQKNLLLSLSTRESCHRFSLDQMQRATCNFHDELVIGKGGFGKVYKGTFEVGPTVVAIKRLHSMSRQGPLEFRTEIEMLSKLRHSHLVSLIGYCDDGNEMILVYEFMPGGTLADHLYKRVRRGDMSAATLSWVQRLKICIGAARGLDYLHTGTGIQHRIIHRDVKTTNILLDENLAAKISDFGLSKISPANQATTTFVSTHVKGTPGYLDPYYLDTHRLTRKSDVYSFGVVLFEVLCGRPAIDRTVDGEQMRLAEWAQHCFREGLLGNIIDPKIKEEVIPDCLEAFVKVAIQCLHFGPKHRPNMAEVVVALESALVLQEKSTDYILPEVITSDDNQDDTRMTFRERIFSVFLSHAARALSGNVPESSELQGPVTYNYKDLKSATKNFSQEYKLGEGGSGDVYKGILKTGNIVAVKRLALITRKAKADLESEVRPISNIRHRNIVRLLGCSSKGRDVLLVYEYMGNGSLDGFLYGEKRGTLNWKQRFNIIIGTARGLAYLHELVHVRLVRRDIRPSQILLDDELQPKITGFGLARRLREDQTVYETTPVGAVILRKYALYGYLPEKVDTYSFGVVLLQIISGRQCWDLNIESHLVDDARKLHENDMHLRLVDKTLDSDEYKPEDVKKVIEIALMCTQSQASLRPTMSEVFLLISDRSPELAPPSSPTFIHSEDRICDGSDGPPSSMSNATATFSEFTGR